MPVRKQRRSRDAKPRQRKTVRPAPRKFVGRDASPVLDHYPPKDSGIGARPIPAPATVQTVPVRPAPSPPSAAAPPISAPSANPVPLPLIRLERPFDVDEFSTLLGETSVRVTVPREDLSEVLRRISEFMGFGIYVYAVTVRPAPSDLLKAFVVELQRVDYSPEQGAWVPFVEKGTSDSPFGPSGHRT